MRPLYKPPPILKSGAMTSQSDNSRHEADSIKSALQDAIGSYCSFCELPITSGSYIHSKRKALLSTRPDLGDWNDYLLSCGYCTDHRSELLIDKHLYLWPDEDVTFTLTRASPFTYHLTDVRVKSESSRSPIGDENNSIARVVLIKANPKAPKDIRKRAQNTIDLYQLNTTFYDQGTNTLDFAKEDTSSETDMRLRYRTQEWKFAVKNAINVKDMLEILGSTRAREALLENVSISLEYSGFWSVWVTVFWEVFKDKDLIKDIFFYTKDKSKEKSFGAYGPQRRFKGPLASPERSFGALPKATCTIFPGTAVDRIAFPDDSGGR